MSLLVETVARLRREAVPNALIGAAALAVHGVKLHAGGPKDAWDIRSLLEVAEDPASLVAAVDQVVPRLSGDSRRLWSRLKSEDSLR